MKLGFLALPEDERRLYFEQAANLEFDFVHATNVARHDLAGSSVWDALLQGAVDVPGRADKVAKAVVVAILGGRASIMIGA